MNDRTKLIMDKVVGLEKRQVITWLTVFLMVVVVLLAVAVVFLIISAQLISDRGVWDVLSLFQEDREIIAEFWQDTLVTFWEELPQVHLLLVALAVGALAITWFLTRRSRKIIQKKWRQIKNYPK